MDLYDFAATGGGFAGIHPARNSGWAQPIFLWALQKEMWCPQGEHAEGVTHELCWENSVFSCLIQIFLYTGSEISALSLPADITAEKVWFWLHHYASHQT